MNENHGLTRENLLSSLPVSLSGDPKMVAIARVIAGVLAERREEIERLAIYPNTAKLEEGLLDILDQLDRICEALDCTLPELLEYIPNPQPKTGENLILEEHGNRKKKSSCKNVRYTITKLVNLI